MTDAQMRRNLLFSFAAGLLFWSGSASLLPTLPLYLEQYGATNQEIGIVMGSFALGLLLFRSRFGQLADERGRKIVLLIGTFVGAIAPLGYLVIKSFPLLMALRVFHGLSVAAFAPGFNALIADIAPPEKRGEIMGYLSLVNPIGVALGPALGGYVQASGGNTYLFLLAGGLALGSFLCVMQIANPQIEQQPEEIQKSKFWQVLLSPRVRVPAEILLLVGLAVGTLNTFVPLFIKSSKIELNTGLFYTAAAFASFSVRLFTGKASDRLGRGLFITLSLLCYCVAMLILWEAHTAPAFLVAASFEGAAGGMLFAILATLMADRSLPQERGRVFALCIVGWDVGLVTAGPVFGAIAEHIGYRNMFGFDAFLTVLALLLFLTKSSKDLPNSLRFALGRGTDIYALKKV
ncbi:MFS transporter [Scytonema hofmannii PCC 7110]|uniref:MFS transporter n=1 Tax=Scytonema hofmannii PCC 7110 TaxID=128403 RepID=A0A139X6S1_9CYAN|nr:MFS transporter [Scytonema hofmannii]KYC40322.1 MFS transporter [Scytonema hofmannii PCC 7110]